ncbi:hypothetical protein N9452_07215 [Alphaproteobacteria bacterium]|nr:hypothetical protein [Alphaproteobacteria bacterium]
MKYIAFNILVILSLGYLCLVAPSTPMIGKVDGVTVSAGRSVQPDVSVSKPAVPPAPNRQAGRSVQPDVSVSKPAVPPASNRQAGRSVQPEVSVSKPAVSPAPNRQKVFIDVSEIKRWRPAIGTVEKEKKEVLVKAPPKTAMQHELISQEADTPSRPKENPETRGEQKSMNEPAPSNANRNVIAVTKGERLMRPNVRRNELAKLAEEMELFFLNRTIR